jgi:membrane protein DedA with SNARE-associated domain
MDNSCNVDTSIKGSGALGDSYMDSTAWLNMILRIIGNPYLGAFIISLLGNLALFFPVPYLLLIFTIALDIPNIGLIPLTFLGALGATVGKLFSYFVGYGGGKVLGRRYEARFNTLRRAAGGEDLSSRPSYLRLHPSRMI